MNHPTFNLDKTQIIDVIHVEILTDFGYKFKDLLKIARNYNINKSNELLSFIECSSLQNCNQYMKSIVKDILYEPDFDNNQFIMIFKKLVGKGYYEIIDVLYDYDYEHEHLIDQEIKEKGISFLNSKFSMNELITIISKNSLFLYHYIIESKIIPESQLKSDVCIANDKGKRYTTLLHVAAGLSESEILEDLLSRNIIDINAVNDVGETPLMEACNKSSIECIKALFKCNNLNFLKCNDKDEDALTITRKMCFSNKNTKIINKDEYLNELITLISNKWKIPLNMKSTKSTNPNKYKLFQSFPNTQDTNTETQTTKLQFTSNKSMVYQSSQRKNENNSSKIAIKNKPKKKWEMHKESFTQEPDPNVQLILDELKIKMQQNSTSTQCSNSNDIESKGENE